VQAFGKKLKVSEHIRIFSNTQNLFKLFRNQLPVNFRVKYYRISGF